MRVAFLQEPLTATSSAATDLQGVSAAPLKAWQMNPWRLSASFASFLGSVRSAQQTDRSVTNRPSAVASAVCCAPFLA